MGQVSTSMPTEFTGCRVAGDIVQSRNNVSGQLVLPDFRDDDASMEPEMGSCGRGFLLLRPEPWSWCWPPLPGSVPASSVRGQGGSDPKRGCVCGRRRRQRALSPSAPGLPLFPGNECALRRCLPGPDACICLAHPCGPRLCSPVTFRMAHRNCLRSPCYLNVSSQSSLYSDQAVPCWH